MKLFAKKRTLADVLAGFQSTLKELDVLITENEQAVLANSETIVALQNENAAIVAETAKASKVRSNITQLIED